MQRFQTTFKKTILTFIAIGLMAGLGYWQLQRLQWKTALIKTITERQDAPLLGRLPDNANYNDIVYRRIALTGLLDDSKVVLLGPRTLDNQAGYYMLVPLTLPGNQTVLVNQGFIGNNNINDIRPTHVAVQSVSGTLRPVSAPGLFTPKNPGDGNMYYWLDLPTIASRLGIAGLLSIYVELDQAAARFSIDDSAYLHPDNHHLQYALFWFVMAFIAFLYYLVTSFRGVHTIEEGFRQHNTHLAQGIKMGDGHGRKPSGKSNGDDTPSLWS